MGWLNKYSGTTTTDTTVPNILINAKKSKTEDKKGLGFSDEELLKQAWKESSFRPGVKNSLGYMGLAQVGDEAIHDYKKAHNLKTFDPYDPTSAKKIQRWYMDKAYNSGLVTNPTQTEENRKLKALAYYNYGPGNLRKVLKEAKSKNIDTYKSDKWLDLLPKETREYGNKILGKDEKFNKEYDSVRALPKYNKIVETYVPKAQDGRKERFSKIDPSKIYTPEEQKQLLREKKIKEKTALLENNLAEAQNRKAFNQSNETARLETLRDNFHEAQNHPLWYLPGSIAPFGAVEDIAINGLAKGFKYLKGLKTVKNPLKLKAINKPHDAVPKSEIDWGKWNKEIPDNKVLMQEYNAIEQKAKADGTWMKNSKGEEFKGTPEQFIQVNSKNFKEAFKDGFSNVYRGASKNNPLLINHKDYKSVFTGDKDLANGYTGIGGKDRFYTSDLDLHDTGIHELAMRNSSNSVEFDAVKDDWLDLQFLERNKATFEKNIAANKKHLDRLIKTKPEAKIIIKNTKKNIQDLEKGYENYKIALENPNYKNMAEYFDGIHSYGDGISTDDIASYLDQSFLDNISIKNVLDGDFGDVHINRQKPGNYLKSLRGNNGMFDMRNPNIYKSVVPGAIGTAAASQLNSQEQPKQFKNGGKVKKKWLDKFQDGGKVKTANTVGNMLGNVGQYFFGIKDEDLQESQYKPTIANETDQKYYTRPGMTRDVFKDLISNRVKKDYNHDGTFNDIYTALKVNGGDREHNAKNAFPKNKAGYKGQYNRGHGSLIGEFNLGRYRTDAGEDDKGRYISFVDSYDWNGMKTENAINFYDRIYEEDWKRFLSDKENEEIEAKEKLEKIRNSPTYNKFQDGGKVIEDNRGQWAHPGKVTKINSNNITMKGVNYPVLGVSDTGDTQMMYPNGEYQYDGKSVTEYPMAQSGKKLVVNSKDDPRYQAYQDSLYNYNMSNTALSKYSNNKDFKEISSDGRSFAELNKYNANNPYEEVQSTVNSSDRKFTEEPWDIENGYNEAGYKVNQKIQYPTNIRHFHNLDKAGTTDRLKDMFKSTLNAFGTDFKTTVNDQLQSIPVFKKPTEEVVVAENSLKEKKAVPLSRKKIQPLGLNSKGLRTSQLNPESKFAGLKPEIAYWDVVEEVNQNFGGNKRTKKVYRQDEIDRIKRKQAADENSFTGKNNRISIKPRITGWLEKYNK